jgi:hypothetical protein
MAALEVGSYIIYFYDKYGTKQKDRKVVASNFTQACVKARRYAKIAGHRSWRIDRCLYNSLDERNKWDKNFCK